jgi:hypothetical protein
MDASALFPAQGPMNGEQLRALLTMSCKVRHYKVYSISIPIPNSMAVGASQDQIIQFERGKSFLMMGTAMVTFLRTTTVPAANITKSIEVQFIIGRTRQPLQFGPQNSLGTYGATLTNHADLPEYLLFNGQESLRVVMTKKAANNGGIAETLEIALPGIEYIF